GENHEIKMDADGHHFLVNVRHVRLVLGHMDGATEQNQVSHIPTVLRGEKDEIATMAVSDEIQPLFVVISHPGHKIGSRKRSGSVAVASRPAKTVLLRIQVGANRLKNVSMEIASGLPPGRVLRPGSVDKHSGVAGARGPRTPCYSLHLF